MLADATPAHLPHAVTQQSSLGDPDLDRIVQGWNRPRINEESVALLVAADAKQRRLALLAIYQAVVAARGLQNDSFAIQVIGYAQAAADGKLTGDRLEEVYHRVTQCTRTSNFRGNCTISSLLLTPELHGNDMRTFLDEFQRAALQTDLNEVVRRALLGG